MNHWRQNTRCCQEAQPPKSNLNAVAWQLGAGHCLDKGGKKLPSLRKQTRHIVDPPLTDALLKARSQKFTQRPRIWLCNAREPDTVHGSTKLDMGFSRTRTETTLLIAHTGDG